MSDRIKLAEAVFYGHVSVNGKLREDFDPFTDANDDYAVLEWMRSFNTYEYLLEHDDRWVDFIVAIDASDNGEGHKANYQIGDYARACLKVIATEQEGET